MPSFANRLIIPAGIGSGSTIPSSMPSTIDYRDTASGVVSEEDVWNKSLADNYEPKGPGYNIRTDSVGQLNTDEGSAVTNAEEGGFSLSDYMNGHPGASAEDIMAEVSKHSDEFAEKYLDYLVERGELDRANEYTANREDTAYQRLVADLEKAGLNPAMMYGSSASPSASGSQGYVKMVEGANHRSISNYDKIKKLLLAFMYYSLDKALGITNAVTGGISDIVGSVGDIFDIIKIFK